MKQGIIRLTLVLFALFGFVSLGFGQEIITVSIGEKVELKATHDGSPPFTYLWYKDGVALPEATDVKYLVNTQVPGEGVYSVVVSNSLGSASSNNLSCKIVVLPKRAIDTYEVISMWNTLRKDVVLIGSLKPLRFGKGGKET